MHQPISWNGLDHEALPLLRYETLLAAVEGGDERDRVRMLRRLLREPSTSWPPALREVVEGAGVGVG